MNPSDNIQLPGGDDIMDNIDFGQFDNGDFMDDLDTANALLNSSVDDVGSVPTFLRGPQADHGASGLEQSDAARPTNEDGMNASALPSSGLDEHIPDENSKLPVPSAGAPTQILRPPTDGWQGTDAQGLSGGATLVAHPLDDTNQQWDNSVLPGLGQNAYHSHDPFESAPARQNQEQPAYTNQTSGSVRLSSAATSLNPAVENFHSLPPFSSTASEPNISADLSTAGSLEIAPGQIQWGPQYQRLRNLHDQRINRVRTMRVAPAATPRNEQHFTHDHIARQNPGSTMDLGVGSAPFAPRARHPSPALGFPSGNVPAPSPHPRQDKRSKRKRPSDDNDEDDDEDEWEEEEENRGITTQAGRRTNSQRLGGRPSAKRHRGDPDPPIPPFTQGRPSSNEAPWRAPAPYVPPGRPPDRPIPHNRPGPVAANNFAPLQPMPAPSGWPGIQNVPPPAGLGHSSQLMNPVGGNPSAANVSLGDARSPWHRPPRLGQLVDPNNPDNFQALDPDGSALQVPSGVIIRVTRRVTATTEVPQPENWYGQPPRRPEPWGVMTGSKGTPRFSYTREGELNGQARGITPGELENYLHGLPLTPEQQARWRDRRPLPGERQLTNRRGRTGLTLWIGLPHAQSAYRYPKEHNPLCLLADCDAHKREERPEDDDDDAEEGSGKKRKRRRRAAGSARSLRVEGPWVILDERCNEDGSRYNPYHNAGYLHLHCLERHFDLADLWDCLDVRMDDRNFRHESQNHGHLGSRLPRVPEVVGPWLDRQWPMVLNHRWNVQHHAPMSDAGLQPPPWTLPRRRYNEAETLNRCLVNKMEELKADSQRRRQANARARSESQPAEGAHDWNGDDNEDDEDGSARSPTPRGPPARYSPPLTTAVAQPLGRSSTRTPSIGSTLNAGVSMGASIQPHPASRPHQQDPRRTMTPRPASNSSVGQPSRPPNPISQPDISSVPAVTPDYNTYQPAGYHPPHGPMPPPTRPSQPPVGRTDYDTTPRPGALLRRPPASVRSAGNAMDPSLLTHRTPGPGWQNLPPDTSFPSVDGGRPANSFSPLPEPQRWSIPAPRAYGHGMAADTHGVGNAMSRTAVPSRPQPPSLSYQSYGSSGNSSVRDVQPNPLPPYPLSPIPRPIPRPSYPPQPRNPQLHRTTVANGETVPLPTNIEPAGNTTHQMRPPVRDRDQTMNEAPPAWNIAVPGLTNEDFNAMFHGTRGSTNVQGQNEQFPPVTNPPWRGLHSPAMDIGQAQSRAEEQPSWNANVVPTGGPPTLQSAVSNTGSEQVLDTGHRGGNIPSQSQEFQPGPEHEPEFSFTDFLEGGGPEARAPAHEAGTTTTTSTTEEQQQPPASGIQANPEEPQVRGPGNDPASYYYPYLPAAGLDPDHDDDDLGTADTDHFSSAMWSWEPPTAG